MTAILEADRSIDDQTLGSSNTEIRMEEYDTLALRGHGYRSDLKVKLCGINMFEK